jgi:hypothetical protein
LYDDDIRPDGRSRPAKDHHTPGFATSINLRVGSAHSFNRFHPWLKGGYVREAGEREREERNKERVGGGSGVGGGDAAREHHECTASR